MIYRLMKTMNTTSGISLLLVWLCSFFSVSFSNARAAETDSSMKPKIITPNYEFIQYRNDNGSRTLTFKISYVQELVPNAIKWKDIDFLQGDDLSAELGKARTDARGVATYIISPGKHLLTDENGMITLGARFNGDEKFETVEDQVSVKDVCMKFEINGEDSLKTALVRVSDLKGVFDSANLKEATVSFYVERMFKPLKIGEATLDENGECSVDFPANLPGDSLGYVRLLARIEEHEMYGNVQADTLIQWGIPTYHKVPASFKALWTKVAPTWMVITLMILLLGVWGHYSFAVYKLVRIKKAAIKEEEEQEEEPPQEQGIEQDEKEMTGESSGETAEEDC
jgi:hypothetical protein